MLVVATFKFSNPVLFFVKVKADNPFLHVPAKRQAPTSPIGALIEPRERRTTWRSIQENKEIGWGFNLLPTSRVYPKFFPQPDPQRLARTTAFDLRAEVRLTSAQCHFETFRVYRLLRAISVNGSLRELRVRPFIELSKTVLPCD